MMIRFLAGRSGPLPLAAWLKLQGAMPILSELNIQKKKTALYEQPI
jgi:hypothetical protein